MKNSHTSRRHVIGRAMAVLVSTVVTMTALAASATAGPATQPTVTLQPGQDQLFSTAFWGETRFCGQNTSSAAGRMHIVNRFGTGDGPVVDIPAGTTQCHAGWYVGVPAKVFNTGAVPIAVTVTP